MKEIRQFPISVRYLAYTALIAIVVFSALHCYAQDNQSSMDFIRQAYIQNHKDSSPQLFSQVCLNNCHIITSAIEMYNMDNEAGKALKSIDENKLSEYLSMRKIPRCALGGSYSIMADLYPNVQCSFHGSKENPLPTTALSAENLNQIANYFMSDVDAGTIKRWTNPNTESILIGWTANSTNLDGYTPRNFLVSPTGNVIDTIMLPGVYARGQYAVNFADLDADKGMDFLILVEVDDESSTLVYGLKSTGFAKTKTYTIKAPRNQLKFTKSAAGCVEVLKSIDKDDSILLMSWDQNSLEFKCMDKAAVDSTPY